MSRHETLQRIRDNLQCALNMGGLKDAASWTVGELDRLIAESGTSLPVGVPDEARVSAAAEMNRLGYGYHESHAESILLAAAPSAPAGEAVPVAGDLTRVKCPCCPYEYEKDSYDAGFIAGSGMCQVCDAAMPAKDLPAAGVEAPEVVGYLTIDATNGGGWRPQKHPLTQSQVDLGALQKPLVLLEQHNRIVAQLVGGDSVSVPVELAKRLCARKSGESVDDEYAARTELRALLSRNGNGG